MTIDGNKSIKGKSIQYGSRAFDIANILFLLIFCSIVLFPLLRVIALSISDPKNINLGLVSFYPMGLNFNAYRLLFTDNEIWVSYKNTILYTAAGTFVSVAITALTAYPLSIRNFVLRKPLTWYLTITMFFSGGLIPTYITIVGLGGINSFWVMIFPGCLTAYNAFIYRTFFQGIPAEMRESAFIDGANDLVIFFRIVLPLSTALLATFGLFAAVQYWNLWFKAMLYLQDTSLHPVQMYLRKLLIQVTSNDAVGGDTANIAEMMATQQITARNIQMTAVVLVMAPIMCVYPFAQKYFVKGVMIGSIKG